MVAGQSLSSINSADPKRNCNKLGAKKTLVENKKEPVRGQVDGSSSAAADWLAESR